MCVMMIRQMKFLTVLVTDIKMQECNGIICIMMLFFIHHHFGVTIVCTNTARMAFLFVTWSDIFCLITEEIVRFKKWAVMLVFSPNVCFQDFLWEGVMFIIPLWFLKSDSKAQVKYKFPSRQLDSSQMPPFLDSNCSPRPAKRKFTIG